MEENGWKFDDLYSKEQPEGVKYDHNCSSDTFYGYPKYQYRAGRVSATFKGSGRGILSYGNCYKAGYVKVSMNSVELTRSPANSRKSITFSYRRGDFFTIEVKSSSRSHENGILQLYSLDIEESSE